MTSPPLLIGFGRGFFCGGIKRPAASEKREKSATAKKITLACHKSQPPRIYIPETLINGIEK